MYRVLNTTINQYVATPNSETHFTNDISNADTWVGKGAVNAAIKRLSRQFTGYNFQAVRV